MTSISQSVLSLGIFVLAAASSQPTPLPVRPPDSCGDPATINQAYPAGEGVVVDVRNAVTLVVDTQQPPASAIQSHCSDKDCALTVRLVNLDAPSDATLAAAGRQSLTAMLRSKHVSLMISPVQNTAGVTNAIVYLDKLSINEQQLESGFATYRSFGPYAIDGYFECRFLGAQGRAKAEK